MSLSARDRAVAVRVSGTSVTFSGDRFLLVQALVNLAGNAVDFSPAGGVVEISFGPAAGGRLHFTVADRGPGVPGFARDRVFERFFSLPRPDGGRKSSGLGLAIARETVLLHGGTIYLRDREGGGTLATIELPMSPVNRPREHQKISVPSPAADD